ncbi:MAG TPA: hypothetical protein PK360_15635, partial [bacterium]|nr:hypothetical protein [bacterium]
MKRFWLIAAVFGLLMSADMVMKSEAGEPFQFLRSPNGEVIIGLIGDLFYPPYPPDFKLEIDP